MSKQLTLAARILGAPGRTPRPAICLWCGSGFTARSGSAKYCCGSHRQLAYQQRKKERTT